ncbi:MAG: (Fe-S)-binding protein [Spirochaetia bacterium]|nr:(Fe-S)-binding protein [Spirochaetia bacterium]
MDKIVLSGFQIILFCAFFFIAWIYASFVLLRRWKLAKYAQPFTTQSSLGQRLNSVFINVLLQKKVLKDPVRGLFHVFVFFGFFAYSLHTLSQFVTGFTGNYEFYIPSFFGESFTFFYENLLDLFTLLVILGVKFFFIRRYFFKAPELDRPSPQSIIILSLIALLMVFTIMETSGRAYLAGTPDITLPRSFIAYWVSNNETASILFTAGWWGHVLTILVFLMYVPGSKHAHLFWAPINFWFQPSSPRGKMPDLDVEKSPVWGAGNVHEFSWKNYLDALSCIECGRCQLACPASRTGKVLSPKKIMTSMKHALVQKMPVYESKMKKGETAQSIVESGECRIIDQVISRDEIWSCTSCYACVETCPVGNHPLEPILQMRRSVVLNEGAMPPQLQGALTNIENQYNPWGLNQEDREKWLTGMPAGASVPLMRDLKARGENPEILYWVGCAGAYDERNKKIALDFSQILNKAGVSFGILGTEESCTGDSARRAGNEYLFQTLASANIEMLNNYGVKKIVTACPHCFNTLKNEYPGFGGNYEVFHHSEFLFSLVNEGKLKIKDAAEHSQVSYHDSCYLGRYNDKYDQPRNVLSSSGKQIVEPIEQRESAMCCGAGGAQMWMEEMGTQRVNNIRTQQLLDTGARTIATACPFCITMIGDGIKNNGLTESHKVQDIAEVLLKEVI